MALVEVLILLAVVVFLFYKWSVSKYHIFRDQGIPHDQPTPLIDTKIFMGKSSFIKFIIDRYQAFKSRWVYRQMFYLFDYNINSDKKYICNYLYFSLFVNDTTPARKSAPVPPLDESNINIFFFRHYCISVKLFPQLKFDLHLIHNVFILLQHVLDLLTERLFLTPKTNRN